MASYRKIRQIMNKRELQLLEKAFTAEINGALDKVPHIMQTRSKLADKLCDEDLLRKVKLTLRNNVTIEGYELTHAGRWTYCETCRDEPDPENS